MAIDTGRLLRLRGAIRGALESSESGKDGTRDTFSGQALEDAYSRYREALLDLVAGDVKLSEETTRLFEPFNEPRGSDLPGVALHTASAASMLGQMAGWIDGLIEEAQMEMNARAYAEARMKEELGIGFGRGESS